AMRADRIAPGGCHLGGGQLAPRQPHEAEVGGAGFPSLERQAQRAFARALVRTNEVIAENLEWGVFDAMVRARGEHEGASRTVNLLPDLPRRLAARIEVLERERELGVDHPALVVA